MSTIGSELNETFSKIQNDTGKRLNLAYVIPAKAEIHRFFPE